MRVTFGTRNIEMPHSRETTTTKDKVVGRVISNVRGQITASTSIDSLMNFTPAKRLIISRASPSSFIIIFTLSSIFWSLSWGTHLPMIETLGRRYDGHLFSTKNFSSPELMPWIEAQYVSGHSSTHTWIVEQPVPGILSAHLLGSWYST